MVCKNTETGGKSSVSSWSYSHNGVQKAMHKHTHTHTHKGQWKVLGRNRHYPSAWYANSSDLSAEPTWGVSLTVLKAERGGCSPCCSSHEHLSESHMPAGFTSSLSGLGWGGGGLSRICRHGIHTHTHTHTHTHKYKNRKQKIQNKKTHTPQTGKNRRG